MTLPTPDHAAMILVAKLSCLALLALGWTLRTRAGPVARAAITLQPKGPPMFSMRVNDSFAVGLKAADAAGEPSTSFESAPAFNVSDPSVCLFTPAAAPGEYGTLKALKVGTATLAMTAGPVKASLDLQVTAGPVVTAEIVLIPSAVVAPTPPPSNP